MTTVALPSTTADPYTAAARVWIRGQHVDAATTVGVVEQLAADLAADPRFRAAIDAGRADLVAEVRRERDEVADLRHRIDVALQRVDAVNPGDAGLLGVLLHHDLPTILRRSTDQH